jgi:hypothetical protein
VSERVGIVAIVIHDRVRQIAICGGEARTCSLFFAWRSRTSRDPADAIAKTIADDRPPLNMRDHSGLHA